MFKDTHTYIYIYYIYTHTLYYFYLYIYILYIYTRLSKNSVPPNPWDYNNFSPLQQPFFLLDGMSPHLRPLGPAAGTASVPGASRPSCPTPPGVHRGAAHGEMPWEMPWKWWFHGKHYRKTHRKMVISWWFYGVLAVHQFCCYIYI